MRARSLLPLALLAAVGLCLAADRGPGQIERLGTFTGRGQVDAQVVGPGPATGSERLYATYTYPQSTFDLLSVDPDTGQHRVFQSPVEGEPGAKGLIAGEDGNLYLGTYPKGYLLLFSTHKGTFANLGRVAPGDPECWIWEMTLASDHRIYLATSPSAKLLRFDPTTQRMEDLGRMSETEGYARYITASSDGFVYVGIGLGVAQLEAYEIASGKHRPILPREYQRPSTAVQVRRGTDGQVYASLGGQSFRVRGWEAVAISANQVPELLPQTRLKGNQTISLDINGRVTRYSPTQQGVARTTSGLNSQEKPDATVSIGYPGKALPPFRFTLVQGGRLLGSTAYPAYLFSMDPATGGTTSLGLIGPGEAYQLLPHKGRMAMALYAGFGGYNLMLFDPERPFSLAFNPATPNLASSTKAINPAGISLANTQGNWRPKAMVHGPDGKIYIGAVPGYGLLGGSLSVWDPELNDLQTFPISSTQSVVSLCTAQGLIVGGTSVEGGTGSRASAKEGTLFLWDPVTQKKIHEVTPVSGQTLVTNLVASRDGFVYGVAGAGEVFKFDPRVQKLTRLGKLPWTCDIYNAAGLGQDGCVYGIAREGVYAIDTRSDTLKVLISTPTRVTAGFALTKEHIYFACGSDIYRYRLPAALP